MPLVWIDGQEPTARERQQAAENERLRTALEDTAYPLGEIDGLMAQIERLQAEAAERQTKIAQLQEAVDCIPEFEAQIERLRTALKIARVMVLDEPLAHALYSNGRTLIQVLNLALGPEQRDGGK
jgi:peptidoglycan hydrolase CwlO-like protein